MNAPVALVGAAASAAFGLGLAALAERIGWLDAPDEATAARKRQARAVPPVLGAALAAALVLVCVLGPCDRLWTVPAALLCGEAAGAGLAAGAFLAGAFLVGLADDLRPGGLAPAAKLLGQAGAGALLGLPAFGSGVPEGLAACGGGVALAVLFLNAANTFDNADGALAAVAGPALLGAGSPAGAPLLGLLVPGLFARRGRGEDSTPRAFLGDAGSHLVGALWLLTPPAWPALTLPLADLARVALLRLAAGEPPWRGDRRHLAHRLAECRFGGRRLSPHAVCAALAAIAAPAALLRPPLGVLATTGLFAAAVAATGDRHPCEGPGGGR